MRKLIKRDIQTGPIDHPACILLDDKDQVMGFVDYNNGQPRIHNATHPRQEIKKIAGDYYVLLAVPMVDSSKGLMEKMFTRVQDSVKG